MATLLVLTGKCQRALGEGLCLFQTASPQLRLAQGKMTEGLIAYHVPDSSLFHRLREHWQGVGDAPAEGVRCPQGRSHPGEKSWEVCVLTEAHGPFELWESSGQVALAEEE